MTSLTIQRYKTSRFWAVFDHQGALICVCVYKCGAQEVVRRLTRLERALLPDPDPFFDPRFAFLAAPAASTAQTGTKENRVNG